MLDNYLININNQVYPYTYTGGHSSRNRMYKEAIESWERWLLDY